MRLPWMVSVPYAKYAETAGSVEGSSIFSELNAAYFVGTASTVAPGTCSPYALIDYLTFVGRNTSGEIICRLTNGSGSFDVVFNPTTLQITSGSFGSSPITSGSISSDYNTIIFTFTDSSSGCAYTLTSTRQ
ncbi:MAG: hypothetical protein GY810_29560 [Aureispira sp.]|nr:hypothetical protein [Aureispira sp.]